MIMKGIPKEDYYLILGRYYSPVDREGVGKVRKVITDAILYGRASGKPFKASQVTGILATTNNPETFEQVLEETSDLKEEVRLIERDEFLIYTDIIEVTRGELVSESEWLFRTSEGEVNLPLEHIGIIVSFKIEESHEETKRDLVWTDTWSTYSEPGRRSMGRLRVKESKEKVTETFPALLIGVVKSPFLAYFLRSDKFTFTPRPDLGLEAPLVRLQRIENFLKYVLGRIGEAHLDPAARALIPITTDPVNALLRLNWLTSLALRR